MATVSHVHAPAAAATTTRPGGAAGSTLAVECDGVSFAYPGVDGTEKPVLSGITLNVNAGERLGILGPNGGGKSTLLKLMLGLLRPRGGAIRVFGSSPEDASRRRLIGYVPQKVEAELAFPLSVRQVVAMSAALGVSPLAPLGATGRAAVEESLELVGAAALANRPIGKLSGGQLQRVMIARALASRPRLLLLDEPTVGIDIAGQQRFSELLRTLHDRLGLTIIVVSHDIRTIASGSDRVACLSRTLHSHVAPEGLTPAVLAEVFSHDVAAIFGDVHIDAHLANECPDPGHVQGHVHSAECGAGVPPAGQPGRPPHGRAGDHS
jgi:zinc transport system ATP-binding protein